MDPRFNSISWAQDVLSMINQIVFGFCWMEAFASWYQEEHDPESGPYSDFFHVSYYADNCIIRINSSKDKVALMIWAFYCPFDIRKKEEILGFKKVLERLRTPKKFAIKLEKKEEFCRSLNKLNNDNFKSLEKYRHLKIHRREPKIIMGEIQDYHYRDYRFPMFEQSEIDEWEGNLTRDHDLIEKLKKNSTFDGVEFKSERLDDLLFPYTEVKRHIEKSLKILLNEVSVCFKILDSRLFPDD